MATTSLTLKLQADVKAFTKNMQKASGSFGKFSKKIFGDSKSIERAGKRMQKFGSQLAVAMTLPIAVVGTASVLAFANFEKAMNQVRAVSKGTEKDFKALTDQAKELGRTTQFSAKEAADGMGFLGQAGFDMTEIFGAMPAVLNLAAAANLDVATSADIASNILAGYGFETEELAKANDVLVKAFISSNTNLEQLGEAMKLAGPIAKAAGFEFEETAAILGLMGNAGIQATLAGTSLRRAIVNLLNPTGETKKVVEEFGLELNKTDGSLKSFADVMEVVQDAGLKTSDIIRLFGVRAGPSLLPLLEKGADGLRKFTEELRNSGGEAERVAKVQLEGLKGSFTKFTSALNGMAIAIGSTFAPEMEKLSNILTDLINKFNSLPSSIQKAVSGVGIFLVAVGPLLIALGLIVKILPSIVVGVKALAVAFTTVLLPAMLPILVAASAVVAGLFLLKKLSPEVFSSAMAGVKELGESILALFTIVKEEASGAQIATKSMFFAIGKARKDHDKEVEKSVKTITKLITKEERKRLGAIQEAMGKKIQLEASLDRERERFARIHGKREEFLGRIILRIAQETWDKQKAFGKLQEDLGKKILAEAQKDLKEQADTVISTNDLIKQAMQGVTTSIKSLWDKTTTSVNDAWKGALDVFVDVLGAMVIQAVVTGAAISVAMAAATAGISLVVGLIASVFGGKGKGVTGPPKIVAATKTFLDSIKDALKGFESEVLSTLERITKSTIKGRESLEEISVALKVLGIQEEINKRLEERGISGLSRNIPADPITRALIDQGRKLAESINLFIPGGPVGTLEAVQLKIIELSATIRDAVLEEFKLKKETINEVINLLKREKDFVKDITQSIVGVQRAFFSPTELFKAQKGDIETLKVALAGAFGEDRLPILADLKSALLASFQSAKDIFKEDPVSLKSWQAEVIKGLEFVRESGKDTFQSLIDVQFEILGIANKELNIAAQMNAHLMNLENAMFALLKQGGILEQIGTAQGQVSPGLFQQLSTQVGVLGLAHGGIVTKPTLAMIAEGGQPEAVIPLSKLGGIGGGPSIINISVNVKDAASLTSAQWEQILKRRLGTAMERINRFGFRSPLQPKPI